MQLSFETVSVDSDNHTIEVWFTADNSINRTGLTFYNMPDFLIEFGQKLLKFPFDDNKNLTYEYGNWPNTIAHIKIIVALKDALGRCILTVSTEDFETRAKLEFSSEVEVSDLQKLANSMIIHDFTVINKPLRWVAG